MKEEKHIRVDRDYAIIKDPEGVGIILLAMLEEALRLNPENLEILELLKKKEKDASKN